MDDFSRRQSREEGPWRSPNQGGKRRWPARVAVVVGFVVLVVVVAVVVSRGVDWFHERSNTTTTVAAHGDTVKVTIDPGMTASEIGSLLEDKKVIASAAEFVDLVKERGSESGLRPGIYQFYEDQELLEVVDMLEKGEGSTSFKLTINEGLAATQVAALLDEEGKISGASYLDMSGKPGMFKIPEVGGTVPEATTLEGLLFPSTYYLLEGDGATELIGRQLDAFGAKTASLPWDKAEKLGLTPYEVIIVASLIEKEANISEERSMVAAVIYNRLKENMTLGIDATVRYALDKWTGSLTTEDLEVDSPYNTRKVKGLPPTPICNPGVAALKAALGPADVDYLYYVLKDTEGHHFFTASYEEFLEAKQSQPDQ